MSNFGAMQRRIAREVRHRRLVEPIKDAIRSAIEYYSRTRFWFNEGRALARVNAGQEWIGLPKTFVEADSLNLRSLATGHVLEDLDPVHFSEIDTRQDGQQTGEPEVYCIYNEQLRLFPIPVEPYQLILAYQSKLSALERPDDTNAWMVEGEALIRAAAKKDIYANTLKDDAQAALMAELERDAFASLQVETAKRLHTGRLKASDL